MRQCQVHIEKIKEERDRLNLSFLFLYKKNDIIFIYEKREDYEGNKRIN